MIFDRLGYAVATTLVLVPLAGCVDFLDPNGALWVEHRGAGPSKRWGHTLVYDPVDEQLVLFGGIGPSGKLNDTWVFSLERQEWTELATSGPTPDPRLTPAAVMDVPRHRMVVVGGDVATSFASEETWQLDLDQKVWSQLADIPGPRFDVTAGVRGREAFFYAGFSGQFQELDDVWVFDLDQDTWRPLGDRGERPASRSNSGLALFDDRIWVTGGHATIDVTADTWSYSFTSTTWTKHRPVGAPGVNSHYAYALDPECGVMYLSGGDDNDYYDVSFTKSGT